MEPRDLATLAGDINKDIRTAETADGLARDARLAAAVALAEAMRQCHAQGIAFYKWCAEHIHFSMKTVEKLVKIGKSDDPSAAMRAFRAKQNVSRKKTAALEMAVSQGATLDGVKQAFWALSASERAEFLAWACRSTDTLSVMHGGGAAIEGVPFIAAPDRARLMAGR